MKLNEISDAEARTHITTKVRASVKTVGLTLINVKLVSINDLYDEVVIDVKLPKGVGSDHDFTHLTEVKQLREMLREMYKGKIRGNDIVGMIVHSGVKDRNGRLVFQVKYKVV